MIRGHAFIQNLRRGHHELAIDAQPPLRLATAFDELRPAIRWNLSPPALPTPVIVLDPAALRGLAEGLP